VVADLVFPAHGVKNNPGINLVFDLDRSENKMFYGLYACAMHVVSVGRLTKGVAQSLAGAPDIAQDLRQLGPRISADLGYSENKMFLWIICLCDAHGVCRKD
jgi:hypothetical protein